MLNADSRKWLLLFVVLFYVQRPVITCAHARPYVALAFVVSLTGHQAETFCCCVPGIFTAAAQQVRWHAS